MNKEDINKPTSAELEILQILWMAGPSSVRFVNDELNKKKKTGYTTTLKLMQIMLEKNLLERDEDSKVHIYHTLVQKEDIQGKLLDRFLESTFSGSAHNLVMQVLGNHKPNAAELKEIRELINRLESKDD